MTCNAIDQHRFAQFTKAAGFGPPFFFGFDWYASGWAQFGTPLIYG
jgi:hypothetical protein